MTLVGLILIFTTERETELELDRQSVNANNFLPRGMEPSSEVSLTRGGPTLGSVWRIKKKPFDR
jgi:hypothetical protein